MTRLRIGQGFDLHRLQSADSGDRGAAEATAGVVLAGIQIPGALRVVAHSDGDVAIHALCDALLGALALGDIGTHFSDRDPRWAGADSRRFLLAVTAMVREQGYRVINVDVTILAEQPKIAPYARAMREALAICIGIDVDAVSIKATTMEGLGAIGRGEAIAAQAVVLLEAQ